MPTFEEAANYEHSFWLHILRDHSQFLLEALPEKEQEEINIAKSFKAKFEELLNRLKNGENLTVITSEAEVNANGLREFKLTLLKNLLTRSDFSIHFTPTFINHMVNELEEYLLVLSYLKQNQVPPIFHELHHHLLWLLDASGHAESIWSGLDSTEKELKKQSGRFAIHFEQFYLKAVELTGYLRTNLNTFPALKRMTDDVGVEMQLFKTFLNEIKEMELTNQMLSMLSPLMADHMYREEVYYLQKLAESSPKM